MRHLLPALLIAATLPAADYYVKPTGRDGASGTSDANAWQTLAKVSSTSFAAGDRILLQGGATFTGGIALGSDDRGTATSPITVTSYGSGTATIANGGTSDGISIYNTGGITIDNLVITGPGGTASTKSGISAWSDDAQHVGLRFTRVSASGFRNGIMIAGAGANQGFRSVLIENSAFHHNARGGAGTWGGAPGTIVDLTVRRCLFHDNPGDPTATSNSGSGLALGFVDNALVEHCLAFDNGGAGTVNEGPAGLWAYDSNRVTFQFCESYRNRAQYMDGDGFDLDQNVTNSLIQYCYSHDNVGAGFLLSHGGSGTWGNNVIRWCVSENDATAARMGAVTFYSVSTGIRNFQMYGTTVYSTQAPALRVMNATAMASNRIANSLFVTTGGKTLATGTFSASQLTCTGNGWWPSGGAPGGRSG